MEENPRPQNHPHTLNFTSLPTELQHDIFCRLPSKPFHICKCVSKEWHSILTSPEFIRFHTLHSLSSSPLSNRLLVFNSENHLSTLELDTASEHEPTTTISKHDTIVLSEDVEHTLGLVGTCNGLVCVAEHRSDKVRHRFFIYNPFTRRLWTVPDLDDPEGYWWYGFGYDSAADDYKIVRIPCPPLGPEYDFGNVKPPNRHEAYLFSFRSRSWSTKRVDPKTFHSCGPCSSKNGYLHWVVLSEAKDAEGRPISRSIGRFNVSSEEYCVMELPQLLSKGKRVYFELGVFEGSLCLQVKTKSKNGSYLLDVWVMKEYGVSESWSRLFRIKCSIFPHIIEMLAMAYSTTRDRVLVAIDWDYYWYDTEGKELEHAGYTESQDGKVVNFWGSIIVCDGTLVSPVCGDVQLHQLG